jgi:hypothetical protein
MTTSEFSEKLQNDGFQQCGQITNLTYIHKTDLQSAPRFCKANRLWPGEDFETG